MTKGKPGVYHDYSSDIKPTKKVEVLCTERARRRYISSGSVCKQFLPGVEMVRIFFFWLSMKLAGSRRDSR